MSAGDFDGLELVMGSVMGLREWDVDSLGRLRGITHAHVWTPGENVSYHSENALEMASASLSRAVARVNGQHDLVDIPLPRAREVDADHSPATCTTCGFYAYYNDAGHGLSTSRVSGVIESYGKVVVGTRGFRAEKAKIVALCPARPTRSRHREKQMSKFRWRFDVLARWFHKHVDFGLFGLPLLPAGIFAIAGGIDARLWFLIPIGALAILGSIYMAVSSFRAISYEYPSLYNLSNPFEVDPVEATEVLLRRNYPDAQFFKTREDMLAAFATDPIEVPTPDTDPDFWTRGI